MYYGLPAPTLPDSSNSGIWEAKKDLARCRVLIFIAKTDEDFHDPREWFLEAQTLLASQSPRAALFRYCFVSQSPDPSLRVVASLEVLATAVQDDLGSVSRC